MFKFKSRKFKRAFSVFESSKVKKVYVNRDAYLDLSVVEGYTKILSRRALKPFLRLQKNDLVLDLGCGPGNLIYPLFKYTEKVTGIDISKNALMVAKKYSALKNVDFILADAENLPIRDECLDKIFAFEVLEHLPNPQKSLIEIYRVLRSKGLLVMLQQYRLDDYAVIWHRFLYKIHLIKNTRARLEIEHIHQLKPEGWARLLAESNFKLILRMATSILPPIPIYYGLGALFPKLRGLYFNIPILRTIDSFLCRTSISSKLALSFIYLFSKKNGEK
jgi:ubiquinone/menaquinone biosynthesis C-methylase UbiE